MPTRSVFFGLAVAVLLPVASYGQEAEVRGVVRDRGRPVAGAVISLEPGDAPVDAAPTTGVGEGESPVVDQRSLRFEPEVLAVRPGTRVEFLNSDPILHSVFSPGWSGEAFDLGTYPSGMARGHVFTELGPHVILCHVHPEMAAYVVVVPTEHHTVTDSEGRFGLRGVPPGRYRLRVWRRGGESRDQPLAVPEAGRRDLVVELSGGEPLVRGGRP